MISFLGKLFKVQDSKFVMSYEYEEDLDILYISNNPERKKVDGSLAFGNVIIDVGTDGKVLGVEIDCASKFFGLNENMLNNLRFAKINIARFGNLTTLGIAIAVQAKEYTIQFVVPEDRHKVPIVTY